MKNIILILSLISAVLSTGSGKRIFSESGGQEKTKYRFVGAEACASKCHNNDTMGFQYDSWKRSNHSKSYESLKTDKGIYYADKAGIKVNPWESMACLKCHSTAAGADTSFFAPTYKREDGVTCEACHKGEFIPKTFLPKEADCLACHNDSVHDVSTFDFKERCLKISHPRLKTKHN